MKYDQDDRIATKFVFKTTAASRTAE